MKSYLELLHDIWNNGALKLNERTGTGTKALFGRMLRFNLNDGFPLLTTKRVFWRGIVEELLWMIGGGRNIYPLVKKGVHIWDEWPFQRYLTSTGLGRDYPKYSPEWSTKLAEFQTRIENDPQFAEDWGDLGEVYGYKWRHWIGSNGKEIDQVSQVIELIRNNPDSRRILVTAWDPSVVDEVALPPCHLLYQFFVEGGKISLMMYQRSVDTFLGLPFNIASYALYLSLMAHVTRLVPNELILTLADTHLYLNHEDQVKLQLSRQPKQLPSIILNPNCRNLFDFKADDIKLVGYNPHPAIKADISV